MTAEIIRFPVRAPRVASPLLLMIRDPHAPLCEGQPRVIGELTVWPHHIVEITTDDHGLVVVRLSVRPYPIPVCESLETVRGLLSGDER